jgi:long-chain fatty acid transport protein
MARHLIGIFLFLVTFVASLLIGEEAFAGGYMIPHQTARGLGLSNALTAGVNDPSAVYYNPGALGEVDGNNLLVNGSYISTVNSVENGGRTARNQHDDHFLASLFANYHVPGSDFTLGIGTYSPFGLATAYQSDFTRFAAETTELKTIYVTPAASWHPSKYFAVGAGLSFAHASGVFSRGLCFDLFNGCVTPGGPLEGRIRLTDTANAFTYNIGVLIKPVDYLKLGFSYRARADLRFDNADVKLGGAFSPAVTKAEVRPLPLPPVIDAGVFWQINPSWGAEFVYEYTRWSEFARFKTKFTPAPTFLPFAVPVTGFSLPENWRNTSTLRFGSFYKITKSWEIRGGLGLEESPIPNKTLNPAIPGADLLTLNGGVGYKWQNFSVDLGYMAVFYKTRNVRNGELEGLPATGIPFLGAGFPSAKDKYRTFNNFVSLSVGYHFEAKQ